MGITEIVYYVYFAIMIGVRAFGFYEGMMIYNISLIAGMLLFMIKIFMTEHTALEYLIGILLFGIAGTVYLFSGEKGMLLYFTMLLGAKAINVSRAYIAGMISVGSGLFVLVLSSVLGFREETYYLQERSQGLIFRHTLGYPHPNSLQITCTIWCMMFIFVAIKKSKKFFIATSVLSLIFSTYVYMYSDSRTGLLSICAYVMFNAYFLCRKKISSIEKILIQLIFPISLAIGIIGPFLSNMKFANSIDRNLLSRFEISAAYLNENGLSIWGQRLITPEKYLYGNYGIDMAYSYLLIQLGIVMTILVAVLFIWFINYLVKNDMYIELSVMLTMVIIGLTESYIFNLGYKNIAFMLMGKALFDVLKNKYASNKLSQIVIRPIKIDRSISVNNIVLSKYCSFLNTSKAFRHLGISIIFAAVATGIYLFIVPIPQNIYSPVNKTERKELKLEASFLTSEDVSEIIANGDVVVGYVDETIPMFKYGYSTASWYHVEKASDIFISTFIVVYLGYMLLEVVKWEE